MKRCFRILAPCMLILALCTSAANAMAQSDDQPLDDKFVSALVIMAVNHNLMEGENEVRDLKALHSFVSDYYDDRIAQNPDSTGALWLGAQKGLLTSVLEEKINLQFGRTMIQTMLALFTDADMMDIAQIRQVVSGSGNPPADYFSTMNSAILTSAPATINALLDYDIITARPSIAPSIAASSSWSHDLPAITSSTAGFRTAGDSQPAVSFGGVDTSPTGTGGGGTLTKPVRFDNTGFDSVTVKVASYTPASGPGVSAPSASTVVSPDGTSSAYLELPLGTYTFCYEWPLDQDYDNDGYFDYHHRTTSSVTLTQNVSDDPNSALVVTLNPDSAVSNPNGKCGEDQPMASDGLTPEETANNGSHTYILTCKGVDWCEGESEIVTLEFSFSGSQATVVDTDISAEVTVLTRAGLNQYSFTDEDGELRTLTLTTQGFTYQFSTGEIFFYTLQDGSTAPSASSQGSSNDSGLTPKEEAVAGTHTYSYYSAEFPDDEIYVSFTVTFSPGAAVIQDTNGLYWIFGENDVYLEKVSENLYSYAPSNSGQWGTVTFTNEGFTETWTDNGRTTYWTLQD